MNTGYNTGLAKVAVQCSADTFVVNQSLVVRINIMIYIKKIIDLLPTLQNSQQRGLLKVLQRMVVESKYDGKLFDTCIKIWEEINNNPALRFQALKTMFNISKKYPDFLNEIKVLTDAYYTDNLTEGVKKSVFRLIKNDLK